MAYNSYNFSALTDANGFTNWHYKTVDPVDVVDDAGYFNDAAGLLRVGDFVFINANIASGFEKQHLLRAVTMNAGGIVKIGRTE